MINSSLVLSKRQIFQTSSMGLKPDLMVMINHESGN
jgi:hypothetical protein